MFEPFVLSESKHISHDLIGVLTVQLIWHKKAQLLYNSRAFICYSWAMGGLHHAAHTTHSAHATHIWHTVAVLVVARRISNHHFGGQH